MLLQGERSPASLLLVGNHEAVELRVFVGALVCTRHAKQLSAGLHAATGDLQVGRPGC